MSPFYRYSFRYRLLMLSSPTHAICQQLAVSRNRNHFIMHAKCAIIIAAYYPIINKNWGERRGWKQINFYCISTHTLWLSNNVTVQFICKTHTRPLHRPHLINACLFTRFSLRIIHTLGIFFGNLSFTLGVLQNVNEMYCQSFS